MTPQRIALAQLEAHPHNSNVMSRRMLAKLKAHLKRTGRYPPLIVRPIADGRYQLLDGHHRARCLRELGHVDAWCVVWPVDEVEALRLLATLNRIEGVDDPQRRAALIGQLHHQGGATLRQLAAELPEKLGQLESLLAYAAPPPPPAPPVPLADMPRAVTFFLRGSDADELAAALAALDADRATALMKLVRAEQSTTEAQRATEDTE